MNESLECTVGDLIEELAEFPPDSKVMIEVHGHNTFQFTLVSTSKPGEPYQLAIKSWADDCRFESMSNNHSVCDL